MADLGAEALVPTAFRQFGNGLQWGAAKTCCLVSKGRVPKNFLQSLLAVLLGNAVYFLTMPYLPRAARHAWNRLDLGLAVDFWVCLVIYGILEMIKRGRRRRT